MTPIYAMQCFLLRKLLYRQLDGLMNKFLGSQGKSTEEFIGPIGARFVWQKAWGWGFVTFICLMKRFLLNSFGVRLLILPVY